MTAADALINEIPKYIFIYIYIYEILKHEMEPLKLSNVKQKTCTERKLLKSTNLIYFWQNFLEQILVNPRRREFEVTNQILYNKVSSKLFKMDLRVLLFNSVCKRLGAWLVET